MRRFRFALSIVGALIGVLAAFPAAAQNQVYDPLPPPGSAYVRFVNAVGGDMSLRPDFLSPQQLGDAATHRVTPYFVVEKAADRSFLLEVQAGARSGHFMLHADPGSFVTVIVEAAGQNALGAVPVVDHTDFNQTRARLSFYNATPDCTAAAVMLNPNGPSVFQDVAPGTAKVRSVNPVAAQIKVICTGQTAAPFALEGLEAGGMYSIWLMESKDGPTAFLIRDVTARWAPP